jgi:hypothetical protein
VNRYDPTAPWDYSQTADIRRLLDVRGKPPHRCFLVHWKCTPLQLSWVWEEELGSELTSMKEQVLAWKATGTDETFMSYSGGGSSRATASESGKCFVDSLRAALWHLGQRDLVP